jgi:macrolide transport system ATP-binding/permease protein
MTGLRILIKRLIAQFRPKGLERQIEEELHTHVEMLFDEYVRRGMPPQEGRYASLRAFGGVEEVKEEYREKRAYP